MLMKKKTWNIQKSQITVTEKQKISKKSSIIWRISSQIIKLLVVYLVLNQINSFNKDNEDRNWDLKSQNYKDAFFEFTLCTFAAITGHFWCYLWSGLCHKMIGLLWLLLINYFISKRKKQF